jgi:hypothetical protein
LIRGYGKFVFAELLGYADLCNCLVELWLFELEFRGLLVCGFEACWFVVFVRNIMYISVYKII